MIAACRKLSLYAGRRALPVLLLGLCLSLGACQQAIRWDKPPPAQSNSQGTKSGQKSARGNPPFYEVFGERYYVLNSSSGFRERGVASWYGKKFHGRPTSSGVIYDMHEMTAAHKTLPLPTRVEVRNLKNGRRIIVEVNDRGPFVDNRIIDLSFAAATELDMIRDGTALVEIVALGDDRKVAPITAQPDEADIDAINLYLQVGAFGDLNNARQLLDRLQVNGFANAAILPARAGEPAIFRVRLGPIADVAEYDQLVGKLSRLDIGETHLVSEAVRLPGG